MSNIVPRWMSQRRPFKIFNPTDLNLALWVNSQNIVDDGSGHAQQLLDISGKARNSDVQTGTQKPLIVTNYQNGFPCLRFDGSNDYIHFASFAQVQPCTVIIIAKQNSTASGKAFWGGIDSVFTGLYVTSTGYRLYAGTGGDIGGVPSITSVMGHIGVLKNAGGAQGVYFNTSMATSLTPIYSSCGANNPLGFDIARYGNSSTVCMNMDFLELLVINGDSDIFDWVRLMYYFQQKYALSWGFEKYEQINLNLHDSVTIVNKGTYTIRNPFGEEKVTYSGDKILVKGAYTIKDTFSNYAKLTVLSDDVVQTGTQWIINNPYQTVTLPTGNNKVINIIEGTATRLTEDSDILGSFITNVALVKSKYSSIIETSVTEKFLFLGDSIGVGANSNIPALQGYANLFRIVDSKVVASLGYGYGRLSEFASDSAKVSDSVSTIRKLFANCTTTKKIIIQLGTNDYGITALSQSLFNTYYCNLIDALYADDSSYHIYCLSPFTRGSEGALLVSYRDGMVTMCSTRSFTTYIDGPTAVAYNTTNFDTDNLHLTTVGHLVAHDYLDDIIL